MRPTGEDDDTRRWSANDGYRNGRPFDEFLGDAPEEPILVLGSPPVADDDSVEPRLLGVIGDLD